MRLIAARIEQIEGALRQRVGAVQAAQSKRSGLLLTLYDEAGRAGQGEASPLPGYSRESVQACAEALRVICRDAARWVASADPVRTVQQIVVRYGDLLGPVPAARFALETALFDLLAQRAGVGIRALLGAPPEGVVARNASLGTALEGALVPRARAALDAGATTLKVKLGATDFPAELEALRALRAAIGPSVTLRLDANGAWMGDEARSRLVALAVLAPEFVEEPVSGLDLLTLGATPVPWAVDESLCQPEVAARLLGDDPAFRVGCAAVVLKPTTLGGLLPALALGRQAVARGLRLVVTHCFDGPVALAAACELALALGPHSLACGLDPHPGLAAWPRVPIPQLAAPGLVIPANVPGLGIARLSPLDAGAG